MLNANNILQSALEKNDIGEDKFSVYITIIWNMLLL